MPCRALSLAALVGLALLAASPQLAAAQDDTTLAEDCTAEVQSAVDQGNCSAIACPDSCIEALAQIPVGCVWAAINYTLEQGAAASSLSQLQADIDACGFGKFFVINSTDSHQFDTGASTTTIVKYLIGICLGAVLMSIVFIILMAAPAFLGKAIGAPTVLVAGGKRAMMQGKAALVQRTEALANQSWATAAKESWASAADAFGGSSHAGKDAAVVYHAPGVAKSAAMEAAAGAKKAAAEAAHAAMEVEEQAAGFAGEAVDAGEAALAGLQHSVVEEGAPARRNDMEGGGTPKGLQAVQTHASEGARTAFVVWAFLAGGLYIASLALLVIGTLQFVHNSVAAYSLDRNDNDGALVAMQWLIIGAIILVGVCDLCAIWIVMAANKAEFTLWRWRWRNFLYSQWVERYAYKIHVVVAGLVTLVMSVACILFGIGLIVVVIQLSVQLFCAEIDSLSVNGIPISDVCINMPTSEVPICGWGAMDICYDITNMGVLTLVLGAALLLWSHIIWFTLLLLSTWRYLNWTVVIAPNGAGESTASLLDKNGEARGGSNVGDVPQGSGSNDSSSRHRQALQQGENPES